MLKTHKVSAIGAAVYIVIGTMASAAQAQTAPAQQLERIEVTGSRIRSSIDLDSTSPVQTISAQQLKASQPVVVEEFIKGLPSSSPAIGSGTNNGTGGAATIDLRGLGSNRTLVLLNGRRMVPYDLGGSVNTDAVPIALLESMDIVTGGASAVYGADAISGVVNFKLKKNFQGVQVDSSYGMTGKNDAKRSRVDVTLGANLDGGKGNVAISMGFTKVDPLLQGARPWGEVALSSASGKPLGSGTTTPMQIFGYGQIDPATGAINPDVKSFNYNPYNFYQTGLNRQQVTALGNYIINDHAEVYAEASFTRSVVNSELAPSATFGYNFQVPLGNPFLPALAKATICAGEELTAAQCSDPNQLVTLALGRRLTELGSRMNGFVNTQYQLTTGVRGDLFGGWTYDVYGSYGKADQVQTQTNWGSKSKTQNALLALNEKTCITATGGCVPLNLWGKDGSVTKAMVDYINLSSIKLQNVDQRILSASTTGEIPFLKSPFSSAPASAALGVEQRTMMASNQSDAPSQINQEVMGTGAASPDRSGTTQLREVFGELIVPLANRKPLIHSLNLEAGYRHSSFKVVDTSSYGTYKLGMNWEPVAGLKVRTMGQTATRSPSINELFAPQITSLDNLAVDPCQKDLINVADAAKAGTLSNLCKLTGVPDRRIGSVPAPSAAQVNILNGGNPTVGPEKAKTMTLGFTFAPAQVKNLTMSVDYWRIRLSDTISNPSVADIIDGCYSAKLNPGFTNNAFCALVNRDKVATGSLNGDAKGVELVQANLGKQNTSGIDFAVGYGFPLAGLGDLNFTGMLTKVTKYTVQPTPNSAERDCLGKYSVSCGAPNPGVKFSQATDWRFGDFSVGYNWRYIGGTKIENPKNILADYQEIKATHYVDLSGVWKATKQVRLTLTVKNLFDKAPPVLGSNVAGTASNSGNTFPQTYDTIGRYFTVGANMTF